MRAAAPASGFDSAGSAPLPTAEQLPNDLAALKSMILELVATLYQERLGRNALEHRIGLLMQRLYGPRGERFDPSQLLLFAEAAAQLHTAETPLTEPIEQPEQTKPKRKCKPHGRRK